MKLESVVWNPTTCLISWQDTSIALVVACWILWRLWHLAFEQFITKYWDSDAQLTFQSDTDCFFAIFSGSLATTSWIWLYILMLLNFVRERKGLYESVLNRNLLRGEERIITTMEWEKGNVSGNDVKYFYLRYHRSSHIIVVGKLINIYMVEDYDSRSKIFISFWLKC